MLCRGKIDWKRYGWCLYYTIIFILLCLVWLTMIIFPLAMLFITDSFWWLFTYLLYFIFIVAEKLYREETS